VLRVELGGRAVGMAGMMLNWHTNKTSGLGAWRGVSIWELLSSRPLQWPAVVPVAASAVMGR
jgi:hypothetical protein